MGQNQVLLTVTISTGQRIAVIQGDITQEKVAAVVNAANTRLAHGGGIAGAIVRRGGAQIQKESNTWVQTHGPVPTGQAAITGGGALPAQYIIHTVGPIWHNRGDETALLRAAVQSALALADKHKLPSIAIPAISSGIFGFPKPLAAAVIWDAVLDYLQAQPQSSLTEIHFCNIDAYTAQLFQSVGRQRFEDTEG